MAITDKWKLPNSGTVTTLTSAGHTFGDSYKNDVHIVDGQLRRIYTVVVHTFEIFDLEDPVSHAAEQLIAWEKSESGQWIMSHAVETPIWHKMENFAKYSADFRITAKLFEQDHTFWILKWATNR